MNLLYRLQIPIMTAFFILVGILLYGRFKGPVVFSIILLWALFFVYQRIIADKILFKPDKNARERWFLAFILGWIITCIINIIILKMVV